MKKILLALAAASGPTGRCCLAAATGDGRRSVYRYENNYGLTGRAVNGRVLGEGSISRGTRGRRALRRNQHHQQQLLQEHHHHRRMALHEDAFWSDLPPDVQAAYTILGFNERMWDAGLEPPSNEMSWDELTPEMQMAAEFLGYTEELWDGVDEEGGGMVALTLPTSVGMGDTAADNMLNDIIEEERTMAPVMEPNVDLGFVDDDLVIL